MSGLRIWSGLPPPVQCRAGLSFPAASPIPRIANSLVAFCAHPARRQQAFDGFGNFLSIASAQFDNVALAHPRNGSARRNTFLYRIERPGIVSLALGRHDILIARKAVLKTAGVEINAAAICVDILATAFGQDGCCVTEAHRLRPR